MLAKYFIERPVLANVIALLVVLIGGDLDPVPARLAVSAHHAADRPGDDALSRGQCADRHRHRGAADREQVNGVENMLYMQSTSADDGTYALTVTFAVGTDLDEAQVQVQNRLSAALASLPQAVQSQGVVTKKKSTAILQIVTLTSPDGSRDSLFLSNYAAISPAGHPGPSPGVGDANVFGIGQYSMRVWLDPNQMKARSLTPGDVINAIQQQSQEVAAGQIGSPPAPSGQAFQFTLDLRGRFTEAAQFEQITVKAETGTGGAITRIRDVGRVELGAQTYSQFMTMDGRPAAGIAIFQLPDANALQVARAVETEMARLSAAFPPGIAATIPFDTTRFVRASLREVYVTLAEAAVLVLVVILLFLQNWRATLVPATTVPVTIIGAFMAMALLGFSINLLTLFALVLAIGIVVDDAIVVVEGAATARRGREGAQGGGDRRDGRAAAADHRHHPRAAVRVPAGLDPAGHRRTIVPAIRPGHRGDRAHQRHQCRDAEADPVRAMAATARQGNRTPSTALFNRGYGHLRIRLCVARRAHGGTAGPVVPGRSRPRRGGDLVADPAADGLHSHRGPGLPDGRRRSCPKGRPWNGPAR